MTRRRFSRPKAHLLDSRQLFFCESAKVIRTKTNSDETVRKYHLWILPTPPAIAVIRHFTPTLLRRTLRRHCFISNFSKKKIIANLTSIALLLKLKIMKLISARWNFQLEPKNRRKIVFEAKESRILFHRYCFWMVLFAPRIFNQGVVCWLSKPR